MKFIEEKLEKAFTELLEQEGFGQIQFHFPQGGSIHIKDTPIGVEIIHLIAI